MRLCGQEAIAARTSFSAFQGLRHGGLGNVVLQGIQRLDIGLGFKSGLSVVLLAIILDRITQSFGAKASATAKSRWAMPAFMHRLMPAPSARSNPTH